MHLPIEALLSCVESRAKSVPYDKKYLQWSDSTLDLDRQMEGDQFARLLRYAEGSKNMKKALCFGRKKLQSRQEGMCVKCFECLVDAFSGGKREGRSTIAQSFSLIVGSLPVVRSVEDRHLATWVTSRSG